MRSSIRRAASISIHAPRAGGDNAKLNAPKSAQAFQSTPPVRGATCFWGAPLPFIFISIHAPRAGGDAGRLPFCRRRRISIHAPRAGGDSVMRGWTWTASYFNPRPPCGGRPPHTSGHTGCFQFQSTPPVRGATQLQQRPAANATISIHAPRAGGDHHLVHILRLVADFNPRPPCGGRRLQDSKGHGREPISIHAPRAGGDC